MKISINEKEFLKVKKLRIKLKNIEAKKKTMQDRSEVKNESYKKLYICEIKDD